MHKSSQVEQVSAPSFSNTVFKNLSKIFLLSRPMSCSTSMVSFNHRNARTFSSKSDSSGARRCCRRTTHRIRHQSSNIPSESATCEIALICLHNFTTFFSLMRKMLPLLFFVSFRCARTQIAVYEFSRAKSTLKSDFNYI